MNRFHCIALLRFALLCTFASCSAVLENHREGLDATPKQAMFLSARVLPVDGYRVRNSLYLTQLMRSPAAASVNVIEAEDAPRMYEEAKYKAMQGQSSLLENTLSNKFLLLSGGAPP